MVNKEKKLVPRLRFEEFEYNNHWIQKMVGEYYTFKNGLNKGKKYFGHGIPIVNYMDVFKTRRLYKENLKGRVNVSQSEQKNYSVLKGDIFFTRTSETLEEIGYPSVMLDSPEKAVFSGFVLRARPKRIDPLDIDFKSYVFYTKSFRNEMIKTSSMSTRALTSGTAIKKMKFKFPENMDEQKQIGNFFKKIDEMIQLQQSKVNKVKDIKSAYLSEMFPKEGEKYPKRRFEGFQGVWKKVRLEQVLNQSGSGGTPRTTREEYYGGDIPFLGISDITNSNGYIFNTEKTITIKGLNNSAAWIVPKESISLAMYASVGKVAILKIKSATSQAFYNMVINNQPTRDYVYQYLVKMEAENMWDRIISTGTQANLNAEKVRNLIIPMPIDIVEQEKIGKFFKNIDNQIYIEEEKLSKLEKLKQAYLNDMFV